MTMIGVRRVLVACLVGLAMLGFLCPTVRAAGPAEGTGGRELAVVGLAGTLEDLESFVVKEMKDQNVPGLAYVVIQGDKVVYAKAFGERKLGATDKATTDTVFEIGSASKAFTASMLAMIVEEGKISWTDRVVDHLPQFRMQDPWVTREFRVADLLCQRSGMPGYSLDNMSGMGFTREDIIRALRYVDPVSSFRSQFAYQNNLWLVAAALIEQKSGLSWEDNLDRRIFGPLAMLSSTTSPEVFASMPNRATGHFYDEKDAKEVLVPMPDNWPYRHWLDTYGPAGSIRSTVLDLAQWVRFQINRGTVDNVTLMSQAGVAYLHAPKTLSVATGAHQTPTSEGDVTSYASGWVFQTRHRHPVVWHNGGTIGMHSIVGYIPEAGVGLAMLTNEPRNQVPELALFKLADLVLGVPAAATGVPEAVLDKFGRPPARRLAVVPMGPPLPLERYVGSYINPAYGTFEVRVREGRLEMLFGPLRFVGVLEPFSGNTFRMKWPDWPGVVSMLTFTVASGRTADKMTIDSFSDVRGGEFVRGSNGLWN